MDCKGQLKDAVTVHRLLAPAPASTTTADEIRQDLEIMEAAASNVQQFTRALAEDLCLALAHADTLAEIISMRYHNSRLRDSHLATQIEFLQDDTNRLRRYIARLQGRR